MRLPRALRPLSVLDYRLVFFGSSLSNVGTWMHRVAVDWLVYQQTDSPAMVGLVSFAQFAPLALVGPLGGVLADRFDRRKLLVAAQFHMMATAIALAILQFAGLATPLVLILSSASLGVGFAFAAPTWHSTIPALVPRDQLTSAIALNSSKRSAARIVGPAIGGLLLVWFGAGGVFVINAISYVGAIVPIWRLRLAPMAEPARQRVMTELRAGLRYARAERGIFWLLVGVMMVSLLAAPLVTLLPVYARDVLGGDAATLGLLTGCLGLGSLIGSMLLAQIGDRFTPQVLVGGSIIALAMATSSVALATGVALMGGAVLVSGVFRLGSIAASNTRVQARADDRFRGRVMSLFMLAFGAAYPLGALTVGAAAQLWGVRPVTFAMGVATAVTGWLLMHKLTEHAPAPAVVRESTESTPARAG